MCVLALAGSVLAVGAPAASAAVPGEPRNLSVSPGASTTLNVSWDAPAPWVSLSSYKVQWKSGSQDYDTARQATVTHRLMNVEGFAPLGFGRTYTIRGLTNGVAYTVRVTAVSLWQWGQFLDHDIVLSADDAAEPFPIPVPLRDPVFDPAWTGQAVISLNRSAFDPDTGTDTDNPRRQMNAATAFVDASQVYGPEASRAVALRTGDGTGMLETSHEGRLLPFNDQGLENDGGRDLQDLFVAGDVRANEQVGLTAMHTLFVREHNRLAGIIAGQDPDLSGDVRGVARRREGNHRPQEPGQHPRLLVERLVDNLQTSHVGV